MDRKKLLIRIGLLVFSIFIVNFLAGKFYWYSAIWYFDMIMHFAGGFWVALTTILLLPEPKHDFQLFYILKVILCVFLVGISWEIFEFVFYNYIAQNSFDVIDTLSDLFFDIFGGIGAILYVFKYFMLESKDSPYETS